VNFFDPQALGAPPRGVSISAIPIAHQVARLVKGGTPREVAEPPMPKWDEP
jgi:hypothetical protein